MFSKPTDDPQISLVCPRKQPHICPRHLFNSFPHHLDHPPPLHPASHPHSALSRLEGNQHILLRDSDGDAFRFSPEQVRLYCRFDLALRRGEYDSARTAYPGGYDTWTTLWNRAEDFPYRFSTIESDGSVIINGQHPEADRVAPLPPPAVAASPFSNSQLHSVQGLLWDLAARNTHKRKRIDESRAAKQDKRARVDSDKAKEVFGGVAAPAEGSNRRRGKGKGGRRDETPVAGPSKTREQKEKENDPRPEDDDDLMDP
ncbi:hypothetical protein C8Q80DRAFT_1158039 [Daedaleopsis nitida]|nr:hypothetical protein C8Q80DRAFT_1189004 [Daedaleopsis nitida]KAI0751565.1 hypothetical protein C8Q80DRAFT_1158039 [Daedaleopsis nitida]